MIISNDNAESRLNNPMNLINKLNELRSNKQRQNPAMSLFGVRRFADSKQEELRIEEKQEDNKQPKEKQQVAVAMVPFINPFQKTNDTATATDTIQITTPSTQAPQVDDLIENSDNKIKLASAHNDALDLLNSAVKEMKLKLSDVNASKLPGVITAASKVVESIRKERVEIMKTGKDKEVHYHFYTPETRKIEHYETIDV